MPHDFTGLEECGDFGQIKEWFLTHQDCTPLGKPIIRDMAFHNVNFGPTDGTLPKSWDGGLSVRSWTDLPDTIALFQGSNVYLTVNKSRFQGNLFQHKFRFVMLAEDWITMLMMQELLRSDRDCPVLL